MTLSFKLSLRKNDFALEARAEIQSRLVTAIVGPSGAGKTTLLRCLAGLEAEARGSILANETTWLGDGEFVPPHRRRIGYVFQQAALFEHLSVSENLRFARKRALSHDGDSLSKIAEATGIEELLDRLPHGLSGGERQRVALARALAANPELLICDEPLSAVDNASRHRLLLELERVFSEFKITTLYVTHNLGEAARISQRCLRLEEGKTLAEGPTATTLTPDFGTGMQNQTALSILELRKYRNLPDEGLSELETNIGTLLVPSTSLPNRLPQRLLIQARDLGISRVPIPQSSYLNQLPATIESISDSESGQKLVKLAVGGGVLYSLITVRSTQQLSLAPKDEVYAFIKSVSLDVNAP